MIKICLVCKMVKMVRKSLFKLGDIFMRVEAHYCKTTNDYV